MSCLSSRASTTATRWMLSVHRRPSCGSDTVRRHLCSSSGFVTSTCFSDRRSQSVRLPRPSFSFSLWSSPWHGATTGQQWRWRHSAKMGHRGETLTELAHRPEREAAQERRQKKKDKAAQKKGPAVGTSSSSIESHDDHPKKRDRDLDFLGADAGDDNDILEDDHDDHDTENGDESVEPTLPDLQKVESQMMLYIERFQETLKSIRGAEPTAEMFDDISVMAYGSPTPLKAVGQVVIVSPTLAQITCFDPSVAKDVQKAIQLELQEVNPQVEDASTGTIKVPLPRVSMQVREQTAKQLKQKAEATKQRIRQVRRKAMEILKKGKDGKIPGISKDEAFASAKELETLTEAVTDRLQKLVDEKIKSIMAI